MNYIFTPDQLNSFKWRTWNTFKTVVLPIILSMLLVQLQKYESISCLTDTEFWASMAYSVLVAIISAMLAGLDKVNRMKTGRSS